MPNENSGLNLKLLNTHKQMMFPKSTPLFLFVLLFSFCSASQEVLITISKTKERKTEGSCVTISCSYKQTNDKILTLLWLKNPVWEKDIYNGTIVYSNTDERPQSPDYSSRVEYITDQGTEKRTNSWTKCDLRINDLQMTDSGNYTFRFIGSKERFMSKEMTLTVTENPCKVNIEPSEVKDSVKEFDEFSVRCSTSASCSSYPVWVLYKPGQEPERVIASSDRIGVSKKVTELKLKATWKDDNMIMSCHPAQNEDICLSKNVTLSVEYAPKEVKVQVSSEDVNEGDPVTFSCDSRGRPNATISWFKDKMKKTQQFKWTISHVKPEDSGEYYCEAENKLGKAPSNIITINVMYGPKYVRATPVVNISNLKEGDELKLECSVENSNPPVTQFKWYLNGSLLQQFNQILTINPITPENKGSYHCEANNGIKTIQSNEIQISVKYVPQRIKIHGETSVKVGSRLYLTCSADANPPPISYSWKHKSTSEILPLSFLKTTGELNIEKVTVHHAGTYTCDVTNEMGTRDKSIKVDVLYPPSKPTLTMKSEGSGLISITCTVQSFPESNPTVTGPFDLKSPDYNLMNITTSENSVKIYLKITKSDAGVYKCTAENSEGINDTEEELLYAPKNVSASSEGEQTTGYKLTVSCNIQSEPTSSSSYEWRKVINGELKETVGISQKLHFDSLKTTDSGDYICIAANVFGETKSNPVHINVKLSSLGVLCRIIIPIILLLVLIALIIFLIRRNIIIKATNSLCFFPIFLSRSSTGSQNNTRENLSMADVPDPHGGRSTDPARTQVSSARSSSNTTQVYSVITFQQMKQGGPKQQESGDDSTINYVTLDFKGKNEAAKKASEDSAPAIYAKVTKKKKSKNSEAEQPDYENVSSACAPKLPITNMDWESDTSEEDEVKYTNVSCTVKPKEPKGNQRSDSDSSTSDDDRTLYSAIKL